MGAGQQQSEGLQQVTVKLIKCGGGGGRRPAAGFPLLALHLLALHPCWETAAPSSPSDDPQQFISITEQMSCRGAAETFPLTKNSSRASGECLSPHSEHLPSTSHAEATDRSISWTLIGSLKEKISLYKPLQTLIKSLVPQTCSLGHFGEHCS